MDIIEIKKQIGLLVEKYLQENYGENYFLVDLNVSPNGTVRVFVDGVESVQFEQCAKLSRHLESYLDENLWLGEKYKLEVSSPGADRPMTDPRQFTKHVGRTCEVLETSGNKSTGKITSVGDILSLERKQGGIIEIPIASVKEVKIVLSFSK